MLCAHAAPTDRPVPARRLPQIYDECRKFTYQTGVRPVVVYGGAPQQQQVCTGWVRLDASTIDRTLSN